MVRSISTPAERGGVVDVRARLGVVVGVLLACAVAALGCAGSVSAAVSHSFVQTTSSLQPEDQLNGLSCTSSTACVAVGGPDYDNDATSGRLFAERWNGRTWSLRGLPTPHPASSQLHAVACPSAADCVAVGSTRNGVLVEAWNGRTWSIRPAPSRRRSQSELVSVSCPSKSDCVAVGDWVSSSIASTAGGPLLERWNGSRWSSRRARLRTSGPVTGLAVCPAHRRPLVPSSVVLWSRSGGTVVTGSLRSCSLLRRPLLTTVTS